MFAYDGVTQPASDLFGNAAAALAAISVAFSAPDATYSAACLSKSVELYTIATAVEGSFASSTTSAVAYAPSKYLDRLAWASAWLYRATGQESYATQAGTYYARAVNYKSPLTNWVSKALLLAHVYIQKCTTLCIA
jgi:hypothetical protein